MMSNLHLTQFGSQPAILKQLSNIDEILSNLTAMDLHIRGNTDIVRIGSYLPEGMDVGALFPKHKHLLSLNLIEFVTVTPPGDVMAWWNGYKNKMVGKSKYEQKCLLLAAMAKFGDFTGDWSDYLMAIEDHDDGLSHSEMMLLFKDMHGVAANCYYSEVNITTAQYNRLEDGSCAIRDYMRALSSRPDFAPLTKLAGTLEHGLGVWKRMYGIKRCTTF